MILMATQQQVCQALNNVLGGPRATKVEDNMWMFTEDDWHVEFEDGEVDLDNKEYDKGYLEDHNWECVVSQQEFVKGPVQHWVLDLLVSLFMHLPSGADNKLYSPILQFLILCLLKKIGEWLAGHRITQLFTALLFCSQEMMMALMHGEVLEQSDLHYSG